MIRKSDLIEFLRSISELLDEALVTHIYDIDDTIPEDCGYLIAMREADQLAERLKNEDVI